MPDIIHVIEPTLANEAGHCFSFVNAFCKAADESATIHLWISREAELIFSEKNIQIRKYFFRIIRRLQSYFLYKKLLQSPGRLFISTAGRADLFLLAWAARGVIPPQKAYLYFHWLNANDKKLAQLRGIANKQPNLEILGPTPSVIKLFQDAGFSNVQVVPYPISKQEVNYPVEAHNFRHLLYAGAARRDKGFSYIVELVAYLHENGLQIPVVLQTSSGHYGKYDAITLADIQRLQTIAYPHLRICADTLSASEYADLFAGAICLQLYDPADFADRVSGVTLDAFSVGCPVVATAGTWIAKMTQRFGAGEVVEEVSPAQVLSAIQRVISDYADYNIQASAGGKILQEENSAETLFKVVAG